LNYVLVIDSNKINSNITFVVQTMSSFTLFPQ